MNQNITRRQFIAQSSASLVASTLLGRENAGNLVEFLWSGALTSTSIRVNAKITQDSNDVRLLLDTNPNFSSPTASTPTVANSSNNHVVSIPAIELTPNTFYYYALQINNIPDFNKIGMFQTPKVGVFSFKFACASCAFTGSNSPIFDIVRSKNPLFFIHLGDMHYENIGINDPDIFRNAFNITLTTPSQSRLYCNQPIAYMWDDHDYGHNNSDRHSASRPAARATYQEYVPHYPLAFGSGDIPISQAFTIGRVRFIMTDTRSERDSANVAPADPNKTMMGSAQKAWFKQELLNAKDTAGLIIWITTTPFVTDPLDISGRDDWSGFEAERREISNFIDQNKIKNLLSIAGDKHMVAIDDGRNNRYNDSGEKGFPGLVAASLQSSPKRFTTDVYSQGQYPGEGQFATVDIQDFGTSIIVKIQGWNLENELIVEWTWGVGLNATTLHLPFIRQE